MYTLWRRRAAALGLAALGADGALGPWEVAKCFHVYSLCWSRPGV